MRSTRFGASLLIAQGIEAGGHARGTTPLWSLLPEVISSTDVPVLGAGGIVDGRDLANALRSGAQGVVIDTAFLASPESFAHDYHKQRILQAKAEETVLTDIFHINWPIGTSVRVLQNKARAAREVIRLARNKSLARRTGAQFTFSARVRTCGR